MCLLSELFLSLKLFLKYCLLETRSCHGSPVWPGTCYVEQADSELRETLLNTGIIDVCFITVLQITAWLLQGFKALTVSSGQDGAVDWGHICLGPLSLPDPTWTEVLTLGLSAMAPNAGANRAWKCVGPASGRLPLVNTRYKNPLEVAQWGTAAISESQRTVSPSLI